MPRGRRTKTVKDSVEQVKTIISPVDDEIITDEIVEDNTETTEVVKHKTFNPDDLVDCVSACIGKTHVYGDKSKETYTFEAQGVVTGIPYKDLAAMVNSKSSYLFRPFIIVKDDDFIEQNPKLKKFYEETWTTKDLNATLRLPPDELKEALKLMPVGIQKSVQELVATKIANGTMDSVSRIKVLDEFFGTQLMLLTGLVD